MRGQDGVVGDDGEAGDTGPAGPVGEPGDPGPEGIKGPTGYDGQPVSTRKSIYRCSAKIITYSGCYACFTGNKWKSWASRPTWSPRTNG